MLKAVHGGDVAVEDARVDAVRPNELLVEDETFLDRKGAAAQAFQQDVALVRDEDAALHALDAYVGAREQIENALHDGSGVFEDEAVPENAVLKLAPLYEVETGRFLLGETFAAAQP